MGTTTHLDAVLAAVLNGTPFAQARQAAVDNGGPKSHSAYERHGFRFAMWLHATGNAAAITSGRAAGRNWAAIKVNTSTHGGQVAAGNKAAKLRADGWAWGPIAERMGIPEARCRKCYAAATNNRSEGQRIGRGGAMLTGQAGEVLYQGTAKDTGTVIATDEALASAKARVRKAL